MKKVFAAIFSIIAALTFTYSVNADKLPDGDFQYQDLEGSSVRIAYSPSSELKYVVDFDNNIFGGPYIEASDFSSYIDATNADGSHVMYDHDGSVLAQADAKYEIYPPENGIYSVSLRVETDEEYKSPDYFMTIYDYETREELCTLSFPVFFWLEQQSDKMVVEKAGKYAFINKYGELQSDFVYDEIKKRFNPDYEPYPKAYTIVVQDGVEKYLDWDLNEIVFDENDENPFITNTFSIYDAELNASERYRVLESKNRCGVYDFTEQRYIIPLQTEYTGFNKICGNYITALKGDYWGIIDTDGNMIAPPEYSYLYPTSDGMFIYNITDDAGEVTDIGILKGGSVVYSSAAPAHTRGQIAGAQGGAVILNYPDPNESYEYAHNYTDYVYEIVNFAGHSLNGELYTHAYISDGEIYATHDYHSSTPTFEKVDITRDFAVINLNGEYLPFDGVIRNSRTLVPMREIVEGLGGTVDWDGDTQSVHAVIDGKEIDLSIGSNIMTVNGTDETLDVAAQIINDKTMLPLRAVSEAVGAEVDWDDQIRCVYINK